ncbi:hypothetical protein F383_25801 [Gossypium arboreum]|uniref:Uncharacterized protein n=1 Tax=Gossypium arboreum TaxID=29729 RepID=A0A0B0MS88_GOSAR|nr:hypothetical protein F383_25801 [Gossypium arboreum]
MPLNVTPLTHIQRRNRIRGIAGLTKITGLKHKH